MLLTDKRLSLIEIKTYFTQQIWLFLRHIPMYSTWTCIYRREPNFQFGQYELWTECKKADSDNRTSHARERPYLQHFLLDI